MAIRFAPHERVIADVTTPLRSLTFPVLEAVLITAVAWIAIGVCDSGRLTALTITPEIRGGILLAWAVGLAWRLALPIWRARRRRFVVTTRRVIVRDRQSLGRPAALPLAEIHDARRHRRGEVALIASGYDSPLVFRGVAKPKQVVRAIQDQLHRPI